MPWFIVLDGQPEDLRALAAHFPNGDVHVMEREGRFVLTGSAFDQLSGDGEALTMARAKLKELSGIVILFSDAFRLPRVGSVEHIDAAGRHTVGVFLEERATIRDTRLFPPAVQPEGDATAAETAAQSLLPKAAAHPRSLEALRLFAEPELTWPRLYRILEELERHLGSSVNVIGLCTDAQRDRFRRSAQVPEVAGADARHAGGQYQPPPHPMTFGEATAFIRGLLLDVLARL
jgi:hypothetical protein